MLRPVIDASAFQLLLMIVTGWLARREREVVAYLRERNEPGGAPSPTERLFAVPVTPLLIRLRCH
jgi:hypothetical protein